MTTIRRTPPRLRHSAARLTSLALAALLAACGGGGGSDDDSGTPVVPSAASITAGNLEGVARQTLVAATYLGDATGLVTGAQVAPGARTLFNFTRAQLDRLPALFGSRTRLVTGVTTTESLPCTGGGTVSVQTTDNNGNGNVDVGDAGTLTASNCVEEGATLSGTISLRFTAVSGDLNTDTFAATAAVTLQSLRASTAAGQAQLRLPAQAATCHDCLSGQRGQRAGFQHQAPAAVGMLLPAAVHGACMPVPANRATGGLHRATCQGRSRQPGRQPQVSPHQMRLAQVLTRVDS